MNGKNSLLSKILGQEIEPNLSYGGVSLLGLSPDQRAVTATVRAYDAIFGLFTDWKIIVINCRDKCILDKYDERCEKCLKQEGRALVLMYKVLGQFVRMMHGEVAFVSFAGTTSGVAEHISTPLTNLQMDDCTPVFKYVFGNGYHLSLMSYHNKDCFRSAEHQITQLTKCVEDLFEMFGKTELLPFIYANSNVPMVQESGFNVGEVLSKITKDNYARQEKFGYGLAGYNAEYARQKASGGGVLVEQAVDWGKSKFQRHLRLNIGLPGYLFNRTMVRCKQLREYWEMVSVTYFSLFVDSLIIFLSLITLKSFSITRMMTFARMILLYMNGPPTFASVEKQPTPVNM